MRFSNAIILIEISWPWCQSFSSNEQWRVRISELLTIKVYVLYHCLLSDNLAHALCSILSSFLAAVSQMDCIAGSLEAVNSISSFVQCESNRTTFRIKFVTANVSWRVEIKIFKLQSDHPWLMGMIEFPKSKQIEHWL